MNKKNIKIASISLAGVMMFTGCNSSKNTESNNDSLGIVRFGVDSLSERINRETSRLEDDTSENPYDTVLDSIAQTTSSTRKDNKTPEEVEETNRDTTDKTFNELKITGKDTSKLYKKSGEDIIFNNVKYEGLASIVDTIEVPCDKRTFINFIVKTYNAESENVNIIFSEDYSRTESSLSSTLDEEFREVWTGYSDILKKYGTPVMWLIRLDDGVSTSVLYGNKDYLIYKGKNGNLEINMSFYDEGGYIEDDVESKSEESKDDTESNSGESKDSTTENSEVDENE